MELEGLPQFWKKVTSPKTTRGAFMGGGQLLAYMGGALGGVPFAYNPFLSSKMMIFGNGCHFEHDMVTPHHDVICKILKYEL